LTITEGGDAFGSKLYLGLLKEMRSEDYPNLRMTLCTNGLLIDRCWEDIAGISRTVKEMSVSVDAASAETYRINRGADWDVLVRNLKFVRGIKEKRDLNFVLRYCVQSNNWREMEDFVVLAKEVNADKVIFQYIQDLGTLGDYSERAIHLESHRDHQRFIEMLTDNPMFEDPIVKTFNFEKIGLFNERDDCESDSSLLPTDRLLEDTGCQGGEDQALIQLEV
jgi:MoaA/NifB/PqqE/SkfB family radical SAM enzyme